MLVRYESSGALANEIKAAVNAYVDAQDTGRLLRTMLTKTSVILTWSVVSYAGLVFFATSWWAAFLWSTSLGLAMAGIGMAIQHDANHGAYPGPRWLRRAMGFLLDLMGGSSYIWRFQHNVNHHSYTNVHDADADIDIGAFARLSPAQPHRAQHKMQHIYLWPMYSLLAVSWVVYADWRDFFSSTIGSNAFPTPKGRERILFWAGKAAWAVIWLIIPLSFNTPLAWLPMLLWTYLVLGFTLSVVFQLAHIVKEAEFLKLEGDPARAERDFFEHQLATTINFATKNRWLTWYLGGLNFQVEHHLFPTVPH
ncbi:MAG: acyl-CoA desaturase, partial [Myxococcota bacterium]